MNDQRKIVVVSGSRGWTDKEIVRFRILEAKPDLVVQGGAKAGADKFAREVCDEENIPCQTVLASWDRYGKAAGFIRNALMLNEWHPNEVICFWDGESNGTKHMIDLAASKGYKLQVNL